MRGKQKTGIIVLVVVAVLFYLTLGVGIMRDDKIEETPEPPGWTHWLDRLTAPLQPRLEPSEVTYHERPRKRPRLREWTLDGGEMLEFRVLASNKESRRAEFVIESDGAGATITYDCECTIDGEAVDPSTLPEPPDPDAEAASPWPAFPGTITVRFAVLQDGGTVTFAGEGEGSHRITLK